MSDTLERIEAEIAEGRGNGPAPYWIMMGDDVRWLVAEVKRLRKRCEEARPLIKSEHETGSPYEAKMGWIVSEEWYQDRSGRRKKWLEGEP